MKPANHLKPRAPFMPTIQNGKPAIFDTVARVFYIGFRSMAEARARCDELNAPPKR